ncbi:MAG TPA: carbamate kinase [Virgibacillus sp.]|nr:carbamate kinase [Virgibacillus sp.]
MSQRVVIALGGNAILQPGQEATYENQLENVRKSCEIIAKIIAAGKQVIVTHGNGPQVGNILRQNEVARDVVPALPLDVCSAESQGFIGYMINQTLKNELHKLNLDHEVISLMTQTEVDKDDPAFKRPTKPIGTFYTKEKAEQLAQEKGWDVKEDAGRGYRRVVASPRPKSVIGAKMIKSLSDAGAIVVASGGGGIPVTKDDQGLYKGIEAVIDKDRSAYQLAKEANAHTLMILTDVPNVYVNYGAKDEQSLGKVSVSELNAYVEDGQFAVGSMGPKVEAAIGFAKEGGESIICSLDKADLALAGEAGTLITND